VPEESAECDGEASPDEAASKYVVCCIG
jgi:hypothetical protein